MSKGKTLLFNLCPSKQYLLTRILQSMEAPCVVLAHLTSQGCDSSTGSDGQRWLNNNLICYLLQFHVIGLNPEQLWNSLQQLVILCCLSVDWHCKCALLCSPISKWFATLSTLRGSGRIIFFSMTGTVSNGERQWRLWSNATACDRQNTDHLLDVLHVSESSSSRHM